MGVLNLRRKELDLNKQNKSGLTPLHLYVSHRELGALHFCSFR